MRYRIIRERKLYKIQKPLLFFFWENVTENGSYVSGLFHVTAFYNTLEQAIKAIDIFCQKKTKITYIRR